jgi:3-methyladenine DNA glycosylase AlkD
MKGRSQSSSTPKKHSRPSDPTPGKTGRAWTCAEVLPKLEDLANPEVRAKLPYCAGQAPITNGVSAPVLHKLAREIGQDQQLANHLWACQVHEGKILALPVGEPQKATGSEMEV